MRRHRERRALSSVQILRKFLPEKLPNVFTRKETRHCDRNQGTLARTKEEKRTQGCGSNIRRWGKEIPKGHGYGLKGGVVPKKGAPRAPRIKEEKREKTTTNGKREKKKEKETLGEELMIHSCS